MIYNIQEKQKRIVTAPQQNLFLNSTTTNIPSAVISIELNENEEVQWIWTIYPNGQRIVTGYNIIQK